MSDDLKNENKSESDIVYQLDTLNRNIEQHNMLMHELIRAIYQLR